MVSIRNLTTGELKYIPIEEPVPDGWILVYTSETQAPYWSEEKMPVNWFIVLLLLLLLAYWWSK